MPTDPISTFDAAVDALNRADWRATTALCDDASLAAFKRQLLMRFDPASGPKHEFTVEMLQRDSPDMPREVAEYHVAQMRAQSDAARQLDAELPGVPSVDTLREMSPAEVFAVWLAGRSPLRGLERLVQQGRISAADAEHARAMSPRLYDNIAVGAVMDGERIAHVVYRYAREPIAAADLEPGGRLAGVPAEEQELSRDLLAHGYPQLATCRRQPDGTWRLVADYGFFGGGGMVVRSFRAVRADDEESSAAPFADEGSPQH